MKMVEWNDQIIIRVISVFFLIILFSQPLVAVSNLKQDTSSLIIITPNQNIQNVINSAPVNATIVFQKGIYTQSFRIFKPLTLIGSGRNETIFSVETKPNNPAITISSSFVSLSNFTLTNTASGLYSTGIRIDSTKVQVSNCLIQDTAIGIAVWNDQVKITKSTFTNCSDEGILLITTSISTSNNNEISDCVFIENCDGIELQRSSNNVISYCIFKGNTHAGIDAICDNNNNNTVSQCTFSNNNAYDIYFSSSEYNRIAQCNLENPDQVVFSPTSSTNIITINFSASSDQYVDQVSYQMKDQSVSKIQIIESFLSKSYDILKTIIEELTSKINKRP